MKIETKPTEYSKQLIEILAQNPLLTTAELAMKLAKSPAWLNDRLGLGKLAPEIAALVDEGRINLSNAYVLAKLTVLAPDEVNTWLDRAMVMSPAEFVPTCSSRVKELKEAKRQGRDAAPAAWKPSPHIRKLSELKDEMENACVGPVLIREHRIKDVEAAFAMGVKWALHMDPASIEISRQKDLDRKAQNERDKAERKREREQRKALEASSVAASLAKV